MKQTKKMMRWYTKKLARLLMVYTAGFRGKLYRPLIHKNCVRVLTYHRFADESHDPFCVSPRDFEEQMSLLTRDGRAVSLLDVLAFLKGEKILPEDSCLVTIDDGMHSTLSEALPILEKYNVPAVAFVSSKLVGLNLPDLPESFLDREQLQKLSQSSQITIGSHAHTHRSMGEIPIDVVREEAKQSKQLLSNYTRSAVASFAYPFGMQKDFSEQTDQVLSESGYSIAFNSMHGALQPNMPAISLPRIKIEGGESLRTFEKISRGAMDDWRLVDERLWRAQRVRREIV